MCRNHPVPGAGELPSPRAAGLLSLVTVYVMGKEQAELKQSRLPGSYSSPGPRWRVPPPPAYLLAGEARFTRISPPRNITQELLVRSHKALAPQPFPAVTFQREPGDDPAEQGWCGPRCHREQNGAERMASLQDPHVRGGFLQQPGRSAQPWPLDTGTGEVDEASVRLPPPAFIRSH